MTDLESGAGVPIQQYGLGIVGAVIGGLLGHFIFLWLARQGFYAMMVPGAALGFGCAAAARTPSVGLGLGCAVAAIGLGIFTEWKFSPFVADDSFGFFIGHLLELRPMTLIMIVLGGVVAYWLGKGSGRHIRTQ